MKNGFSAVQKLGKSLMLPIAVLPVAGMLLRLGQPDLLDLHFIAAAGNAVFANLGLLFAIGVAVGLAKGNNGAAGLAAVVAYFVTTEGAKSLIVVPSDIIADALEHTAVLITNEYKSAAIAKLSVPAGLICGILAGALYNRFSEIRLSDSLAFFAGRRFVPIVTGFAALPVAALFGNGWSVLESGMNGLSAGIVGAGEFGLFAYGALNRLLIISGLHHILNNITWFLVGDFAGVTGDLRRFFAGDPSAGIFMSGFFPVMMFGLPAACLAMYHAAPKEKRKKVGGLLMSMALTSFLTGITEPIEFAFMFLAPLLFVMHAVLTGVSMVVMDFLEVRLGFGFSAGLFDYILNFNKATQPWLLWPVGFFYFGFYYLTFRFFILKFNIKTPGRDDTEESNEAKGRPKGRSDVETAEFLSALGGPENLLTIDACMTRLRLEVVSNENIDENSLRTLGAAGVIKPTKNTLQVVVGLRADEIASNIRRMVDKTELTKKSVDASNVIRTTREIDSSAPSANTTPLQSVDAKGLIDALGGRANILQIEALGTRLRIRLNNSLLANEAKVLDLGYRGLARPQNGFVHVVTHLDAQSIASTLDDFLASGR